MKLRTTSLIVLAAAAATSTACSDGSTGAAPESPGENAQEIAWGSTDTGTDPLDQLKRDVVVRLVGDSVACSGTLVSPRIVITASHCLRGTSNPPLTFVQDTPNVSIGESVDTPIATVQAYGGLPYINRPVNASSRYENATDVAILYLPPSLAFADDAISTRPSFDSPAVGSGLIAGFAPENLVNGLRQVGGVSLDRTDVNDARYFDLGGGAALRPGDSGGALFVTRADGTRDLIGVNSGGVNTGSGGKESYDADVTSLLIKNFITTHVQDASRTDRWFTQHARTRGDYWLGEVDYTGPCQGASDADCDHWYDGHDNCPTTSNIDQLDTNDDGVGDACSRYAAGRAALVEVDPNNAYNLYKYSGVGTSWSQAGGTGAEFVVNDDAVFGLAPDRSQIWRFTPSTGAWDQVSNGASLHLFAGGHDLFATSPTTGRLSHYLGTKLNWMDIGAPGKQFVVNENALYGLSSDGKEIWRYRNSAWDRVSTGGAGMLYAGGTLLLATDPLTSNIAKFDGTSWSQLGGPGLTFAVSPSNVIYAISRDGKVTSQIGGAFSTWTPIGGVGTNLFLNGETLYESNSAGDLYRYNGAPGNWTFVRGGTQ